MNSLFKRGLVVFFFFTCLVILGGCSTTGTSFDSFIGGQAETYPYFPSTPSRNGTGWEVSSD